MNGPYKATFRSPTAAAEVKPMFISELPRAPTGIELAFSVLVPNPMPSKPDCKVELKHEEPFNN